MKKLIRGENDLLTICPNIAKEWNYEKNGDLKPSDVLPGSHKKVWWKCQEGHEWEAIIKERSKGKPCPYCSNYKVLSGFNDLATVHPEVAEEWNYEKNGDLKPEEVKYSANLQVWWKCKNGHEWEAYVFNRSKGSGCPYCNNIKVLKGYNDLATTHPELAKEWDYERNGDLKPTDVLYGSHKRVWWKCKNGHEWETEIKDRGSSGQSCPYCSNKRVLIGYNDLYTYCVNNNRQDLIEEFDTDKNGFSMTDISIGSSKEIWWKCKKGHSYKATASRRRNGTGCGICSHNVLLKNYNDLLTTHPEIAKEWDYEKNEKGPDEVMAGSNTE